MQGIFVSKQVAKWTTVFWGTRAQENTTQMSHSSRILRRKWLGRKGARSKSRVYVVRSKAPERVLRQPRSIVRTFRCARRSQWSSSCGLFDTSCISELLSFCPGTNFMFTLFVRRHAFKSDVWIGEQSYETKCVIALRSDDFDVFFCCCRFCLIYFL